MPFATLGRRTAVVTQPTEPQEEQLTPSASVRGRSLTLPSISPRKSFSSLFGSSKRGRSPTPSPEKSDLDALEGDLYPEYDASNPDHDPQRASSTPSADKPRRFRRAPSPHPLKGSTSSAASRLSWINGGTLNRTRPHPCLTQTSPPRSFLGTLADAIKVPASLFYKENKQSSGSEEAGLCGSADAPQSHDSSPKKSVRFRPGSSLIEPNLGSSPVDIPQTTPSLPPVQLATTPLQHCFKNAQPDPVPTARPPQPQMLKTAAAFHQAIATTDPCTILKHFDKSGAVRTPPSDLSTPVPGMTVENFFEDPFDVDDLNMLHGDDGSFHNQMPESHHISGPVAYQRFKMSEDGSHDLVNSETTASAVAWIRARDESEQAPGATEDEGQSASASPGGAEIPLFSHVEHAQDTHSPSHLRAIDPVALSLDTQVSPSHRPPNVNGLTISSKANRLENVSSNEIAAGSQESSLGLAGDSRNVFAERLARPNSHKRFRESTSISSIERAEAASVREPNTSEYNKDCSEPTLDSSRPITAERVLQSHNIYHPLPQGKPSPVARPTQERKDLGQENQSAGVVIPELKASEALRQVTTTSMGSSWTAELAVRSNKPGKPADATPASTSTLGCQLPQPSTHLADAGRLAINDPGIKSPAMGDEKVYESPEPRMFPLPKPSPASKKPPYLTRSPQGEVYRQFSSNYIVVSRKRAPRAVYRDQYGWSPFDERHFAFAALAFIESSGKDIRQLICQHGGFGQFWHWCGLPHGTAPFEDTRGLEPWEIDQVLNTVHDQDRVPRSIVREMVEDFRSRIQSALVRNHTPLRKRASFFAPIPEHRPEETGETLDDSLFTEEEPSLLDPGKHPFCISANELSDLTHDVDLMSKGQTLTSLAQPPTMNGFPTEGEIVAKPSRVPTNLGASDQRPKQVAAAHTSASSCYNTASSRAASGQGSHLPVSPADGEVAKGGTVRRRTATAESEWSTTSTSGEGDGSDGSNRTRGSTPPSEATEDAEKHCRRIV